MNHMELFELNKNVEISNLRADIIGFPADRENDDEEDGDDE